MRLDSGMIHTRACMQWCAYYTWEILHTPLYRGEHWLTQFLSAWKTKADHFHDHVEVVCVYLQERRRITFNFKPTRGGESYSVYICLDRLLNEAIWAKRVAPYDPSLETGDEVWDIDWLFQGFDYRHLNEEPINLE